MHEFRVPSILVNFRFQSKINEERKFGFYRNVLYNRHENGTGFTTFNQDVTQLQAIHARRIFPCFDQPDMKGT